MAKNYDAMAKEIIDAVGGPSNISSVTHCVTRLRFILKDESIPVDDTIKKIPGVLTVIRSGGQYQVVVGQTVGDIYDAVLKVSDGKIIGTASSADDQDTSSNEDDDEKDKTLIDKFVSLISGIFLPLLPVLMSTGFIKGLNALLLACHALTPNSGTYMILNAIGDGFFYFMPIFLGYTSAKKFKLNPFIGMAIAAALVYPTFTTVMTGKPLTVLFNGTWLASNVFFDFLHIPVILMRYTSSVIPIILATYFASRVDHFVAPHVPTVLKTFLTPSIVLLVSVPVSFLVIGPVATWIGNIIGQILYIMYNFNPVIAGVVIGFCWEILVVFGLHWGLVPISINNMSTLGFDPIMALSKGTAFAGAGAVLGILVRSKDIKVKEIGIPAMISCIFGVSEPAIYGLMLPRKKPFYATLIGAACGGLIMGMMGTKVYTMGSSGILGFSSCIDPKNGLTMGFWGFFIAAIVSFLVGFLLSVTICYGEEGEQSEKKKGFKLGLAR